jgi:ubiquitin carboxyl-terminal hydrolase 4/11/15
MMVVVTVLQFGELLVNLWSGKYTTVVPREFKSVLSKFAPQFAGIHSPHHVKDLHCSLLYRGRPSRLTKDRVWLNFPFLLSFARAGYQQHDSQELLSFVLDGIHEDLNRYVSLARVRS